MLSESAISRPARRVGGWEGCVTNIGQREPQLALCCCCCCCACATECMRAHGVQVNHASPVHSAYSPHSAPRMRSTTALSMAGAAAAAEAALTLALANTGGTARRLAARKDAAGCRRLLRAAHAPVAVAFEVLHADGEWPAAARIDAGSANIVGRCMYGGCVGMKAQRGGRGWSWLQRDARG